MTKRTPEQIAADEKLLEAVREAVAAYDVLSGGMLIDFMIICEGVQLGSDDREEHGILFMENRTRTTVAYGLLEKGHEMLQMQSVLDLEDDEK